MAAVSQYNVQLCVKSTSEDILRIKPERQDRFDMACLKVIHSSAGDKIAHCFSYGDAHWYGAAEVLGLFLNLFRSNTPHLLYMW